MLLFLGYNLRMKTCYVCKKEKSYSEFHKSSRQKDGYAQLCKYCKAKQDKEYREKNKEKLQEYCAAYYENNKEQLNASRKARYYNATPQEVVVRQRKKQEYNQNAPTHVKERKQRYDKKYFASEKGKITTAKSVHKRRAQKISSEDGTVTSQALEELKVEQNNTCRHCGCLLDFSAKGQVHLDHLIPLSKGGAHTITNVVWSCASCNLRKSDKLL